MEDTARRALARAHPGREFTDLDLVLVDDRPGVHEDRAHFEATDGRRRRAGGAQPGRCRLGRRAGRLAPARPACRTAAARYRASTPENDLERRLAADPVLLEGWRWGKPARGHPEGAVGAHVADLLRTIDEWGETGVRRSELRFLALVHDSLKFQVQHWRPRTGREPSRDAGTTIRRDPDGRRAAAGHHRAPRPPLRDLAPHAPARAAAASVPGTRCARRSTGSPTATSSCASSSSTARPRASDPEPIEWLRRELGSAPARRACAAGSVARAGRREAGLASAAHRAAGADRPRPARTRRGSTARRSRRAG